jgi:hypothetical protein
MNTADDRRQSQAVIAAENIIQRSLIKKVRVHQNLTPELCEKSRLIQLGIPLTRISRTFTFVNNQKCLPGIFRLGILPQSHSSPKIHAGIYAIFYYFCPI